MSDLYPVLSTSDEKIKQYKDEIESRNTHIAVKGSFFVALAAFAATSVFGISSVKTILCAFYLLLSGFSTFYAYKAFGSNMKTYSEIACCLFLLGTIPIWWFQTGGFYGLGNVWFIFTTVHVMLGSKGTVSKILFLTIIIEFLAIVSCTYLYPEMVMYVSGQEARTLYMASIPIIGGYFLYVGINRQMIASEAAINIAVMQDDLTAQNEELISINEELLDISEKLKLANETQRHFTASMNHELRAPLNGIEGCLQIMMMRGKLDAEDAETVKNAIESSKTINQTVNDLLDFAKLEKGKFDIIKTNFNLKDILNNELNIFVPLASAKGLEFVIYIPRSTRISLYGDGVRIQQIMTNLLSNAIKYTDSGKVTMAVTTNDRKLVFRISDTGRGMRQEEIDSIFDPFSRFVTGDNSNVQGTGLGMNIVHNLLKQMNGSIEIESRPGVGSNFRVSIPIMYYDAEITYCNEGERKKPEPAKDISLSDLNILYADDLKINRTVMKGLLRECEANLSEVESGYKAIEECAKQKYDIIILDHMMPGLDGVETMDIIRSEGLNKDTPIVMLTGNTEAEYKELYYEHGATGYLEKPVTHEKLIEVLNKAVGEH